MLALAYGYTIRPADPAADEETEASGMPMALWLVPIVVVACWRQYVSR